MAKSVTSAILTTTVYRENAEEIFILKDARCARLLSIVMLARDGAMIPGHAGTNYSLVVIAHMTASVNRIYARTENAKSAQVITSSA